MKKLLFILIMSCVVTMLTAIAVEACDMPVWNYMLQWEWRSPYGVFYFYKNSEDKADSEVNEFLQRLTNGEKVNVNLYFTKINVSKIAGKKSNDLIKALWQRHAKEKLPFYVVISSSYQEIYSGKLTLQTVKSMINSPVRGQIARQLCDYKHGLLLILNCEDEQENAAVREIVEKALSQYDNVGLITVDRNDPKEKWLVQQLLSVERDLKELSRTMVFCVFGRGYVMPPYLGKGITKSNIIGLIEFMSGPCTCNFKAGNYGTYLLTNLDWQKNIANPYQQESVDDSLAEEESSPNLLFNVFLTFGIILGVVLSVGLVLILKRRITK